MEKRISLGYRPRGCRHVKILGVRPNLNDYPETDRRRIEAAGRILYPTPLYAQVLTDAGKQVFPSARHYYYLGDKIRQTALFDLLKLPHPRTRCFYGRQARQAGRYFQFPFVAKIPRGVGQGRGVALIRSSTEWATFLARTRIVYVQEYIPLERDLRVVIVAGRVAAAYWRTAPPGEFRTNVHLGGRIDFRDVPEEGVAFALEAVRACRFDDVGLDVVRHLGRWLILEANMHYGLQGLGRAGVSLSVFLDGLIEEGVI